MAYRRCDDCPDEASCAIRWVFARTHRLTADLLDRTTLADALAGVAQRLAQDALPGDTAERQQVA